MLTLAIESSAKAASVCLCRDGERIAQSDQRCGLTHSRTLLPMIESMFAHTEIRPEEIDAVAVAVGPGSFTGIRIGVSTAKGLCWGLGKPAIGVSTLESMAWLGLGLPEDTVICPAMDARRGQIYNAFFALRGGAPGRMTKDRAISVAEAAEEAAALGRPLWVTGDGAEILAAALRERGVPHAVAPELLRWQNAWGVALAAAGREPCGAEELLPVYLRLSQAERERQARMKEDT